MAVRDSKIGQKWKLAAQDAKSMLFIASPSSLDNYSRVVKQISIALMNYRQDLAGSDMRANVRRYLTKHNVNL